jgi:transcriptional regulator with XRE-family HTH domain
MMGKADIDRTYKSLGIAIRKARITRKLSQTRLAELIGLQRTSITNIELGRQRLLLHTLIDIASVLAVPAATLLESVDLESQVSDALDRYAIGPKTRKQIEKLIADRQGE